MNPLPTIALALLAQVAQPPPAPGPASLLADGITAASIVLTLVGVISTLFWLLYNQLRADRDRALEREKATQIAHAAAEGRQAEAMQHVGNQLRVLGSRQERVEEALDRLRGDLPR